MPQRRVYLYLGVAVLIIIIGVTLRFFASPQSMVSPAGVTVMDKGGREIKGSKPPSIGGRFTLISQDGRPVTDADFRGKNTLVFFGFTNCPDVCPLTLNNISRAMVLLGADANKIQPLFISVDPLRDTPNVLRKYLKHFDHRIIGLTGTPKQVVAVQRAYRIFAQRRNAVGSGSDDYLMDHTSISYMMGPSGEFKTFFSNGSTPEEFVTKIRQYL
ncbi:MAG: SCO family protein [Rhodospirillaceae bacterium]|nr:SCO family protein [Rhodospirillaceae bacterium]